jgi:uncharacterized protein DUF2867
VSRADRAIDLNPLHGVGCLHLGDSRLGQIGELPWDDLRIRPGPLQDVRTGRAEPAVSVIEEHRTLSKIHQHVLGVFNLPTRVLWRVRDRLGRLFDLGSISTPAGDGADDAVDKLTIPGTNETSLAERLPDDLRNTAADVDFGSLPFVPLYRTDVEFAAELSNRTVHAVMHLAWVDQGEDHYQGQMAVYVKPRGAFGKGYMALIKPVRHWIVYPAIMRQTERAWNIAKA